MHYQEFQNVVCYAWYCYCNYYIGHYNVKNKNSLFTKVSMYQTTPDSELYVKISYRDIVIAVMDINLRILLCTDECSNIFGIDSNEIIGSHIYSLLKSDCEKELLSCFHNNIRKSMGDGDDISCILKTK